MKKIVIFAINIYQAVLSTILKNILGVDRMCRFSPTCSEYTRQTILKEGVFMGLVKSLARILRCQPFFSKHVSGGSI